MPWLVLLLSAVMEAVWATALGLSQGLTQPAPTAVFVGALVASTIGLSWSVKHIPIGTAYAVWTGIGAALTVAYAMATGVEPVNALRLLFLAGIVTAVIGLKLIPATPIDGPPRG